MKDFIRKCLTIDEGKRLSYSELLDHPFIKNTMTNMSLNIQYEERGEKLGKIMDTTKEEKNFHYRLYWFEYLIRMWEMTSYNNSLLKYTLWKQIEMEHSCLESAIYHQINSYSIQNWSALIHQPCWKKFKCCFEGYANKVSFIEK